MIIRRVTKSKRLREGKRDGRAGWVGRWLGSGQSCLI